MIGRTNCTQKSGSPSEFVNIQMLTNQAEHSNLNGAVIRMSYETYSKQYTWDGSEITFSVPAHVSCAIEFPEVEGYKKPDNITFVAVEGNSRTIEAEYKAELVKVNVTSSNGSAVSGAKITINGKVQTWNGTEIRQLVPFGTQYSVVAGAVSGFGTPSTQTFTAQNPEREVSVVYIASSLKVNILSNQGTDAAIANVKATVKYGSTSVQVANGSTVNLPTNTSVTISFPDVADYKKPADITYTHTGGLVEKSGTYQCELLTVNVSADSGSVSGFEVTISKLQTVGIATKYTKLEYIENPSSAWIDTGFTANGGMKATIGIMPYDVSSQKLFFGSHNPSSDTSDTNTWQRNCIAIDSSTQWEVGQSSNVYRFEAGAAANNMYDVEFSTIVSSAPYAIINGTKYTGSYIAGLSITPKTTVTIMRDCYNTNSYLTGRVYYAKIYDKNLNLVRDYIPVLRSDGVVGLYDTVNDTFTSSSGSVGFTAGEAKMEEIAIQTSVTGSYKIPFDTSYAVQASKVNGYDTPANVIRMASSKSYTVTQEYKVITVRDLSMMDVYGNPINRSTANCYVVREAGQYKFPLVYGNAIKNGKVNTAAFTNNGGANSHDFVNGYNSVIASPYIYAKSSAWVEISNSDADGVISNIEISNEADIQFITFNVTHIPSTGANAIISIHTNTGLHECWSWHIWLWPHDLTPVEITNSTGVKYNIMPVNLASKYDSDGVHIKNWFYQWGRPNPMLLPSAWNSTTDHTPGTITKSSKIDTLANSLYNPTKFYYNSSSPYNWFGTKSYYNLWDAACTGTGNSDNDTVKTVYDPCPVGWKVPNGNTFTGLSILSSTNGIVKMRRYSGDTVGVGFPLSGYQRYTNGELSNIGSNGCVWLSSASSQDIAHNSGFDSEDIYSHSGSYRASGHSVRPVQDDLTKIDTI